MSKLTLSILSSALLVTAPVAAANANALTGDSIVVSASGSVEETKEQMKPGPKSGHDVIECIIDPLSCWLD